MKWSDDIQIISLHYPNSILHQIEDFTDKSGLLKLTIGPQPCIIVNSPASLHLSGESSKLNRYQMYETLKYIMMLEFHFAAIFKYTNVACWPTSLVKIEWPAGSVSNAKTKLN